MLLLIGMGNNHNTSYLHTPHNLGTLFCYNLCQRVMKMRHVTIIPVISSTYVEYTLMLRQPIKVVFFLCGMNITGDFAFDYLSKISKSDYSDIILCYDDYAVARVLLSKSFARTHNGIRSFLKYGFTFYSLRIGFKSGSSRSLNDIVTKSFNWSTKLYYEYIVFEPIIRLLIDESKHYSLLQLIEYIDRINRSVLPYRPGIAEVRSKVEKNQSA